MGEVSNITIPLKTEKWQEDVLNSRFGVCRDIYNAMLNDKLKALEKMQENPEYARAVDIISAIQGCRNAEERKKLKEELGYKEALETRRNIHTEYGFTEFSFTKVATHYRSIYKDIIPTNLMILSVAKPLWAAFDRLLNGKGETFKRGFGDDDGRAKTVHFKRRDGIKSLVTDGLSGIRVLDEFDKTTKKMHPGHPYHIQFSSKKGKTLNIPLKFPKNNLFLQDMLERDIKQVRVQRKVVRGKYKYELILCVAGKPAEKRDRNGNHKHPVKDAPLGIYIDTTSITIAADDGTTETIKLSEGFDMNRYDEQIKEINRKMDASRRAMNPDNYNADGTIKTGKGENDEGTRLRWNNSKTYRRLQISKSNIERIVKEQRKMNADIITHRILALGNKITVNDMNFAAVSQMFGGKTIGRNAPSQIITKLTEVAERSGGYVNKVKMKAEKEDRERDGYRLDLAGALLELSREDQQ